MAVYKRTYKAYHGPLTPAWSRFTVLSRYGLSTLFSSRPFTAYTVLCFLPFLAGLAYIYVVHSTAAQALLNVGGAMPDAARAEGLFRRLLAQYPRHKHAAQARVRVGLCLYLAKKYPEAVTFLTQAGKGLRDPALAAEAHLLIGRSHHDAGQSSHSKKNNRVDRLRRQPMASICFFVSQIGRKNW